jgi:hypothetical protein
MAPTKKLKLLKYLEKKGELINIHVEIKYEIPTFQEKELENEEERDVYMSLEERYAPNASKIRRN